MRNGRIIGALVLSVAACVVIASIVWSSANRPSGKVAPSAQSTPTSDELARTGVRALFIGDSWIDGSREGGQGDRNWSRLVANKFGWEYRGLGIAGSGYVVGGKAGNRFGSSERVSRIIGLQPDVLLISNGLNDILDTGGVNFSTRLSQIDSAATDFYQLIRKDLPQTVIVAIGYIPPGESSSIYVQANSVLASAASRADIRFINPTSRDTSWFSGRQGNELIGADRYHPTDAGNSYLAEKISEILVGMRAREWPQVYASNLFQPSVAPRLNPFANQP